MKKHYESEHWLLLHLVTTEKTHNKIMLFNNDIHNSIVIDLNLATDNTFYLAFDGHDCLASEFPTEETYELKAKINLNDDDAILEIGQKEKILFKRIMPSP